MIPVLDSSFDPILAWKRSQLRFARTSVRFSLSHRSSTINTSPVLGVKPCASIRTYRVYESHSAVVGSLRSQSLSANFFRFYLTFHNFLGLLKSNRNYLIDNHPMELQRKNPINQVDQDPHATLTSPRVANQCMRTLK